MVLGSICFSVNGNQEMSFSMGASVPAVRLGVQRLGDTVSRSERMAAFARSHAKVTEHNRKSDRILSSNQSCANSKTMDSGVVKLTVFP